MNEEGFLNETLQLINRHISQEDLSKFSSNDKLLYKMKSKELLLLIKQIDERHQLFRMREESSKYYTYDYAV